MFKRVRSARIRVAAYSVAIALWSTAAIGQPEPRDAERPILRVAVSVTPNTLNPIVRTQTTESLIVSFIFDGLVRATPDGKIIPILAATVPSQANGGISRDGRTITYKLRRGIRWHDGAAFTSRDVAFSQRASVDPNNNNTSREPYRSVATIETPDDATVVVHLAQPYAPFVAEWFGAPGEGIVPEHLLGAMHEINDAPFNAAPVGTGAFIFDHWDRGHEIVLRANDTYHLGKPKIRRIVVQLLSDENSRTIALRSGETDWSYQAATTSARQIEPSANIVADLRVVNSFTGLRLQVRRPPLDDVRVRRAIAYALDRPTMVAKINGEYAEPASCDIGPAVWAYDPTVKSLPFDPARSRELLAMAGWKLGSNGVRERDGKPLLLLLLYPAGNPANEAYAVQIESMLRAVGFDLQLKPQQANLLFAPAAQHGTLSSGNFDLAFSTFTNYPDPDDRRSFACDSIPPNGFNISRWCNAAYDRATHDALLHFDRAQRKDDYTRASRILADDVPEVFVAWQKEIELVRAGVHVVDGDHNFYQPYRMYFDRGVTVRNH